MLKLPWLKQRDSGTAGVALSGDAVAAARVLREDDNKPRLQGCACYSGETSVKQAAQDLALDRVSCVGVMPERGFQLLLVEAPEVDPTELRAAVRWRIKDLIDFHVDDAVVDVFDIPDQRGGRARMMYVVAARTSTVRQHIALLENAGVNLEVIDIPELALRNVAAMLPEDKTGVALLHLGPGSGTLTITRQGDLYLARTLDVGADLLAAEMEAEAADIEGGGLILELEGSGLPPRLQRLFDGMVLEIQRSLDYYESHFSLPPPGGLVVAPLDPAVPPLLGYLAGNLGIPVRILDLNAVLDSEVPLSDALQACCLTAIGAALRQGGKAL